MVVLNHCYEVETVGRKIVVVVADMMIVVVVFDQMVDMANDEDYDKK